MFYYSKILPHLYGLVASNVDDIWNKYKVCRPQAYPGHGMCFF